MRYSDCSFFDISKPNKFIFIVVRKSSIFFYDLRMLFRATTHTHTHTHTHHNAHRHPHWRMHKGQPSMEQQLEGKEKYVEKSHHRKGRQYIQYNHHCYRIHPSLSEPTKHPILNSDPCGEKHPLRAARPTGTPLHTREKKRGCSGSVGC